MRFGARRYGMRKQGLSGQINSSKNVVDVIIGNAAGTNSTTILARAVDAATNAVAVDVTRGCKIYRIWVEIWVYATQEVAVGVTTQIDGFIIKNPGANLTVPSPGTVGTSNEKKFVFKESKGLIGARTEGATPYQFWRGWIRIPKTYQRMGADDLIQLVLRPTGTTSVTCLKCIYKWFT